MTNNDCPPSFEARMIDAEHRYLRRLFASRFRFDGDDERFSRMKQRLLLEALYDNGAVGLWRVPENNPVPLILFPQDRSAADGSLTKFNTVRAVQYRLWPASNSDNMPRSSLTSDDVVPLILNLDCLSMRHILDPLVRWFAQSMTILKNNLLTSQTKFSLKNDPSSNEGQITNDILSTDKIIIRMNREVEASILDEVGTASPVRGASLLSSKLEDIGLSRAAIMEVIDAIKFIKTELSRYAMIRSDQREKKERHISAEFMNDTVNFELNEEETVVFLEDFVVKYNDMFDAELELINVVTENEGDVENDNIQDNQNV